VSEPLLVARNLRRIAMRVAPPAIVLALFKPAGAFVALALVPVSLLEFWAVDRASSRGRSFPIAVGVGATLLAFAAEALLATQAVYASAVLRERSASAGIAELGGMFKRWFTAGPSSDEGLFLGLMIWTALGIGAGTHARCFSRPLGWRPFGDAVATSLALCVIAGLVLLHFGEHRLVAEQVVGVLGLLSTGGTLGMLIVPRLWLLVDFVEWRLFGSGEPTS
jgi:hypothetical protein